MLHQSKNLFLLCSAFFFIFLGYSGVQQHLTIFFSQSNQASLGFRSLFLIYFFFLVSSPIVPIIFRKVSLHLSMILSAVFYAIFNLSILSTSSSILYLSSAMLGIAGAVLWNALNIYLIESSDETNYGKNSGIFSSCVSLGGALGILNIWLIAKYSSYNTAFALASLLPIIAIFFLSLLKEKRLSVDKVLPLGKTSSGDDFSLTKKMFSNSLALRLSIPWFSFAVITALVIGLLPLEIGKRVGTLYVGPIFFFIFAVPIFLSYPLGKISDRKGRKSLFVIAFLIGIIGLLLLLLPSLLSLFLGILSLTLFYSILKTCNVALVGDVSSAHNIKFVTSVFWTMQNAGMVIGLLLSLFFSARTTYFFSVITLFVLFLLFTPLLQISWKQLKEKLAKETASK